MSQALRRNRTLLIATGIVVVLLILLTRQYEPRVTAGILLSGLTLGALYFLVAAGLSLIFGLLDVLNFAHGLFFMLGAYAGYTLYANPRMILNTLPLVLALAGGALIGAPMAGALAPRIGPPATVRVLGIALGVVAAVLTVLGVAGLDLPTLAASSATSAGGAVATVDAEELADVFVRRVAVLVVAGLALGALLGGRQVVALRRPAPALRNLIWGAALLIAGFTLVYFRLTSEAIILGLPSDLRFLLALAFGGGAGALLGALVESTMIRPLYSRPIYQVLLTLGLVLVGQEAIKGIWGPAGFYMDIPAFFNGGGKGCPAADLLDWFGNHCSSIEVLGRPFPSYRIFLIGLGILLFAAIALLLRRTRLGMIIRAGVQDSDMVQALGINVRRIFTLVFALGTGLAALGGVAAAPFVGVSPGLGEEFLLLAFISVVIGGMGSYSGAAVGALLVGLARAFGDQLVLAGVQLPGMAEALKFSPSIARASTVLLMAVVLLVRPAGLFGRKE